MDFSTALRPQLIPTPPAFDRPRTVMTITDSNGKVTVELPSGASAEIMHFGATVISWKSGGIASTVKDDIKERFFLSSKSALDGSKPVSKLECLQSCKQVLNDLDLIRYAVASLLSSLSSVAQQGRSINLSHLTGLRGRRNGHTQASHSKQHRVCRSNLVRRITLHVPAAERRSGIVLEPSTNVASKYRQPFLLEYFVKLSQHELITELHVTNPSNASSPLVHQALLHNYIAAAPTSSITVSPLTDLTYIDKVKGGGESVENRELVDVNSFTDSVYKNAPGAYEVRWEGGGMDIKTTGFPDVVVWNPHAEAGSKIGDLEDGGW